MGSFCRDLIDWLHSQRNKNTFINGSSECARIHQRKARNWRWNWQSIFREVLFEWVWNADLHRYKWASFG